MRRKKQAAQRFYAVSTSLQLAGVKHEPDTVVGMNIGLFRVGRLASRFPL
jgi:hypothetical protein